MVYELYLNFLLTKNSHENSEKEDKERGIPSPNITHKRLFKIVIKQNPGEAISEQAI